MHPFAERMRGCAIEEDDREKGCDEICMCRKTFMVFGPSKMEGPAAEFDP